MPPDPATIWRSVCSPGIVLRMHDPVTDTWVPVDVTQAPVFFKDPTTDTWIDASCITGRKLTDNWEDGTNPPPPGGPPEGGGGASDGDGGVEPGVAMTATPWTAVGVSDLTQPVIDAVSAGDKSVLMHFQANGYGAALDALAVTVHITAPADPGEAGGEAFNATVDIVVVDITVNPGAAAAVGEAYGSFDVGSIVSEVYSRDFFSSEVVMRPYPVYSDTLVPFMASYSSTLTIDTAVLDLSDMTVTTDSTTVTIPSPSDTLLYLHQAGSDKVLQESYYFDDPTYHWKLTLHDLSGTELGVLDYEGTGLPVTGSYTPALASATDGSGSEFLMLPDYESGNWVVRVWDVSGVSPSMTPVATGTFAGGSTPYVLQHVSTGGWTFSDYSALMSLAEDGTVTELVAASAGYYFRAGKHGWVGQVWSVDYTETTFTIFDETATEIGTLTLSGLDPDNGYAISTGPIYHSGRWWIQVLYEYNYNTYIPPDEIRLYSCTDAGTFVLEDTQSGGIWGEAGVVPLDATQFMSYWRRDPTPSTNWWEGAYDFVIVTP